MHKLFFGHCPQCLANGGYIGQQGRAAGLRHGQRRQLARCHVRQQGVPTKANDVSRATATTVAGAAPRQGRCTKFTLVWARINSRAACAGVPLPGVPAGRPGRGGGGVGVGKAQAACGQALEVGRVKGGPWQPMVCGSCLSDMMSRTLGAGMCRLSGRVFVVAAGSGRVGRLVLKK